MADGIQVDDTGVRVNDTGVVVAADGVPCCCEVVCQSCGDCCFSEQSTVHVTMNATLRTSFCGSIVPVLAIDDDFAWVGVGSGVARWMKTVSGLDYYAVFNCGAMQWSLAYWDEDLADYVTLWSAFAGDCCGGDDERTHPGTFILVPCVGGGYEQADGTISFLVGNNKCCRCGDDCQPTADNTASACVDGINKCMGDQQPDGGCGCNDCVPALADVYHVAITLADTTFTEGDVTNVADPETPCYWSGPVTTPISQDINLFWDGTNWKVTTTVWGTDLTGGTDPCDPTNGGSPFTDGSGNSAVVT